MRITIKHPFSISRLAVITAALMLWTSFAFAQEAPPPPAPPKPKTTPKIAQPPKPAADWIVRRQVRNESEMPAEKAVKTGAKVNVSLCVSEGKIKINGWDRNEVRAYVSEGTEVGFKILQKSRQTDEPVWIKVLAYDPSKSIVARADECLAGEAIEIDVPRGAVVNIKSRESATFVQSVAKASVENVGGDIFLSDIAYGVEAKTYEGDVTVEKSGGAMYLSSIVGNILAFDVSPSEVGDIFKAKTSNGAIVLQKVEHRQMDVGSNSGSIKFEGEFLGGGQYDFGTQNGSIMLTIPQNSSSKIYASYGFGSFNSEIPLKDCVKPPAAVKVQNISCVYGAGEATVKLTTYTGSINVVKPVD